MAESQSAFESRFSAITVDHFQRPRNVGRMAGADGVGRVDDHATDTLVEIYVKRAGARVVAASFRTFGCSACIAASSMATELLVARSAPPTAAELDLALGALPADKHYCLTLVAEAARQALATPS